MGKRGRRNNGSPSENNHNHRYSDQLPSAHEIPTQAECERALLVARRYLDYYRFDGKPYQIRTAEQIVAHLEQRLEAAYAKGGESTVEGEDA